MQQRQGEAANVAVWVRWKRKGWTYEKKCIKLELIEINNARHDKELLLARVSFSPSSAVADSARESENRMMNSLRHALTVRWISTEIYRASLVSRSTNKLSASCASQNEKIKVKKLADLSQEWKISFFFSCCALLFSDKWKLKIHYVMEECGKKSDFRFHSKESF